MKKLMIVALMVLVFLSVQADAHQMYIKKTITNENGIEFGVDNASGFVRWRAYVKGVIDNSQGQNSGWLYANSWWYYDLDSISQRVMWRLDGIANQKFIITYWVFRSDGTWEYGPQVEVISDQILPSAQFTNLYNGQVFDQETVLVQAVSSDNLSGVEAIRLYVVVPAGYNLSGWIPSGLPNQYYKEFIGNNFSHYFAAPGEGVYTFTLWVKDKAGNIAYEPGGPVSITIDLSDPPPPPPPPPPAEPPAAPTNLQLGAEDHTIYLSWQDNATNESGYVIKRNDAFLVAIVPNSTSYVDTVDPGDYCYQVYASNNDGDSDPAEACITILPPNNDYHYADSFQYPVEAERIYRIETDADIPLGSWYDYQPFASLFAYLIKIHLGIDLNLKGFNDLGEPLYAIANALIWKIGWTSGWGNYLILRIQPNPGKAFRLSDGRQTTEIFVLYAHLDEIRAYNEAGQEINLVEKETYVAKGWQIGTVGDGNGNYSPHLHFEVRINGYDQVGPGYWPVDDLSYLDYFVDPIEFIDINKSVANQQLKVFVHAYDQVPGRNVQAVFDGSNWQRQGREYDGLPLASVGWANHIYMAEADGDKIATWQFYVPQSGAWSVYSIIPRYYAQAENVTYRVWHDRDEIENPKHLFVDQSNDNENKKVYLGTYDFYQGLQYKVDLIVKAENNSPLAAFDTIELIYEGDIGTGGGENLPPDPDDEQVKTINSSGTITFKYAGSYAYPELHCYGGDFIWEDLILTAGLKEQAIEVSTSAVIYCNIEFEDGQWLADSQGILDSHHLYVDEQEIRATEDNGLGGRNILFNLSVDNGNTDPPDDDDPSDTINLSGDFDVSGSVNGSGFGCSISSTETTSFLNDLVNMLIMFSPAFYLMLRKLF